VETEEVQKLPGTSFKLILANSLRSLIPPGVILRHEVSKLLINMEGLIVAEIEIKNIGHN
jgi:hypothetical protein